MKRFTDKAIIVTGAASGLGLATAQRLAQEGGKLLMVDIDGAALENAAKTLSHDDVTWCVADVSREADVRGYVRQALDSYGRIDGFFNNAGIEGPQDRPTDNVPANEFRRVLSVNLDGVFYGMSQVLKIMREQGHGSIVNTSSVGGIRGIGNQSAYAASKAGVVGLTRNAAVEYGRYNIQINAIAPGAIMTGMVERGCRQLAGDDWEAQAMKFVQTNPMRRAGAPEEFAALAAFLLSGEARYLNGVVIPIDGGQSIQF